MWYKILNAICNTITWHGLNLDFKIHVRYAKAAVVYVIRLRVRTDVYSKLCQKVVDQMLRLEIAIKVW